MSSDRNESGMRVEWGVRHSQGIRKSGSERAAREDYEWLLAQDARRRREARGKVRIVRREVGPWEDVETEVRP